MDAQLELEWGSDLELELDLEAMNPQQQKNGESADFWRGFLAGARANAAHPATSQRIIWREEDRRRTEQRDPTLKRGTKRTFNPRNYYGSSLGHSDRYMPDIIHMLFVQSMHDGNSVKQRRVAFGTWVIELLASHLTLQLATRASEDLDYRTDTIYFIILERAYHIRKFTPGRPGIVYKYLETWDWKATMAQVVKRIKINIANDIKRIPYEGFARYPNAIEEAGYVIGRYISEGAFGSVSNAKEIYPPHARVVIKHMQVNKVHLLLAWLAELQVQRAIGDRREKYAHLTHIRVPGVISSYPNRYLVFDKYDMDLHTKIWSRDPEYIARPGHLMRGYPVLDVQQILFAMLPATL